MSFEEMLAACDDTVLAALTSPGLVRRAHKAQVGAIEAVGDGFTVSVGNHSVEIDSRGPRHARCDCPATGNCLHIAAAAIALRKRHGDAPVIQAAAGLLALTPEEIRNFAGTSWEKAWQLAFAGNAPDILDTGSSVEVRLPDLQHAVMFPAGSAPLADAVWKGTQNRRGTAVTAAVLAFRASRNVRDCADMPGSPLSSPAPARIDPATLDDVMHGIEEAMAPVLGGSAAMAIDRLFDLSLSARVSAVPRLAAELRGLMHQAGLASTRDRNFLPERFLAAAAHCHALAHAIARQPGDPVLSGILRRFYNAAPSLSLVACGARVWRNQTGARGLTTFLYDLHQGRWVIGSTARAGGADPAFDPRQAYDTPILGAPSGRKLMGMSVRLSNPRISADGVLALGSAGELRPTRPDELPTGHRTWAAAHRKVRAALGSGLRRGTAPVPVVLSPSFVEEPHQDPFSERFLLPLRDATGATMDLCLDAGAETAAARLSGPLADTVSLLAEAEARAGELTLTLVSVMVGGETPHVANLALDPAPDIPPVSLGQRLARFADPLAGAGGRAPGPDPVAALARDALTAATGMAVGVSPQRQLPRRAETLGLASLAAALEAEPSARTALRCAYLASEVLWACGGDAGERDGAQ